MIILASASPRRKELLSKLVNDFQIIPADIDETPYALEKPDEYVVRMAREKAEAVASQHDLSHRAIVIASDTSVVLGESILGKPTDFEHAKSMLRALSGRKHQVMTSLCVCNAGLNRVATSNVISDVEFREISDLEIEHYWNTGEPADKAGAYAIQGLGGMFVKHISGSFSAVVGLPVYEVTQLLAEFGVSPLKEKIRE
ncbi:Maf-like protein YhdE [Marinomonas gallaica]|uniref:dTTP/UTP pyrophosphatase n=1 Tax=Marinomonas gallaica TaxID=1806667 RepID=A0A1C3JTQ6_9GAMM|nr:Maf family protein [Marinomonas gallaica]SBT18603.1 Maf-like protein YhdE [Marinomonas gallaica]SBT21558.1 Maf-like protein YhdE [Marinomonas gallaica]